MADPYDEPHGDVEDSTTDPAGQIHGDFYEVATHMMSIHQKKGRENIFSCSSPGNQAAILECFLTFADPLGEGGSCEGGLEGAT